MVTSVKEEAVVLPKEAGTSPAAGAGARAEAGRGTRSARSGALPAPPGLAAGAAADAGGAGGTADTGAGGAIVQAAAAAAPLSETSVSDCSLDGWLAGRHGTVVVSAAIGVVHGRYICYDGVVPHHL
jgi:hypothetical protein